MGKTLPGGNRTDRRRSLGNNPVKSVAAPSGTRLLAEVVVPAAPSSPNGGQAPAGALSPDRVSVRVRRSVRDSSIGSAQEEDHAQQAGEVLVDVDTGPGGLGMVFWFQGG